MVVGLVFIVVMNVMTWTNSRALSFDIDIDSAFLFEIDGGKKSNGANLPLVRIWKNIEINSQG